jgi:hypothetical protein
MAVPGIEQKRILRAMERFGQDVMPKLTKHFGDLSKVGIPAPKLLDAAA